MCPPNLTTSCPPCIKVPWLPIKRSSAHTKAWFKNSSSCLVVYCLQKICSCVRLCCFLMFFLCKHPLDQCFSTFLTWMPPYWLTYLLWYFCYNFDNTACFQTFMISEVSRFWFSMLFNKTSCYWEELQYNFSSHLDCFVFLIVFLWPPGWDNHCARRSSLIVTCLTVF